MPSQFPYDPSARDTCERIDWHRVHPQSLTANVRKWRRVSLQDLRNLTTNPTYARMYEAMPMELKSEFKRRLDQSEEAEDPIPTQPRSSKEQILKRVDDTIEDAEIDGDLVAKLRGLELMAKVEQLLSTKVQQDPTITINVVTGVSRE